MNGNQIDEFLYFFRSMLLGYFTKESKIYHEKSVVKF